MKQPADYETQDLVASSETLLEDVHGVEDLLTDTYSGRAEQKVSSEILKRFVVEEEDVARHGHVEVYVSGNEMEARADFIAPSAGGQTLDLDEVSRVLAERGVTFEIDWDTIKGSLFHCNTDRIDILDTLIARGQTPVGHLPERLVIEPRLLARERTDHGEAQQIDFRDTGSFVIVNKGDVLARLIPEQQGQEGYTVYGKALAYTTGKISRLKPGINTHVQGDRAVAECDGRFLHNPESFWVNEILDLAGDVDYRTGHIDFPGDVYIRGEIKAGFHVHCGGSLFCTKTMDASEVLCGQDLTVGWGLIGRKSGKVKVGGELRAKFIENCYVESRGSILVAVGILNSAVYCGDCVETGKKGVIAGGSVRAQNGIHAAQLGTRMGPRTELYCGTDYVTEQKLEWIRNKNLELAFRLKQVESQLKKSTGNQAKLLDVQGRIKEAIHKLNEAAQSLIYRLDRNDKAEVVVSGYVYPGVYVEICHVSFVVVHTLKGAHFYLDKEKGKIITDPLL